MVALERKGEAGSYLAVLAEVSKNELFEAEALPHMTDIFRTAARLVRDGSRAEDLVQDVYVQAWKSFHRFEPGTNCRAWLFKILFHCLQHQRRKWYRFPLLKDSDEHAEANIPYTPAVPEHVSDEEILAALDRIPTDFRAVVLLIDVQEFSYKEAAEIISVPVGTVMSRLSRARRLLRDHLAKVAESYGVIRSQARGERA